MDVPSADLPDEPEPWWRARPPALVPVPAADISGRLRGRRAIVAHPGGIGFAAGLRIVTEPHAGDHGRVQLGLLYEADYYRALITGTKTPSQAWEIENVYVEEPVDLPLAFAEPINGEPVTAPGDRGRPQIRWPQRPSKGCDLVGARVVVAQPEGCLFGQRVVSGLVYGDAEDASLAVCPELGYYRWVVLADPPEVTLLSSKQVWLE